MIELRAVGNLACSIFVASDLELTEEIVQRICSVASWDKRYTPDGFSGDRSALLHLAEPLHVGDTRYSAIKLKAVGFRTREGQFVPPSTESYRGRGWIPADFRFVEDRQGFYEIELGDEQPVGGTLLHFAQNEYLALRHAFSFGAPVPFPIGYGRYDSPRMLCNRDDRQDLGFVVLGLPDRADVRVADYLVSHPDQARLAPRIFRSCGLALRRVADSGVAHPEAHHQNFSVSLTTGSDNQESILVHDFERFYALPDCGKDVFVGYVLAGFRMLELLLRSRSPRFQDWDLSGIDGHPESLLFEFYNGFFDELGFSIHLPADRMYDSPDQILRRTPNPFRNSTSLISDLLRQLPVLG